MGDSPIPQTPRGMILHPLVPTGEGPTCSDPTGEGPPPSGPVGDGPTSSDPWGQSCRSGHTGEGRTSSGPTGMVLALGPHGEGTTSSDTAGDGPSASGRVGDGPLPSDPGGTVPSPAVWTGGIPWFPVQEHFQCVQDADVVCAEHRGPECLVPWEERCLLSAVAEGGVASVPSVGVLRPRKGLEGDAWAG